MTLPTDDIVVGADHTKRKLDRSAFYGAAWSGAAKWTTQLISWVSTFAIARILMPSDYGLVTMASVYLGLLTLMSEFGIGSTIVARSGIDERGIKQLNALAVSLGFGAFLLSAMLAWPLGLFFHAPELPPLIIAMSLTQTITGFQVVPSALLRREMRFKTLATVDLARGALVPIGTLLLAVAGLRYWALVGGSLLSSTISTIGILVNRRCGYSTPRFSELGGNVRFSGAVLGSRLAWFVYSNADFTVAGKRLGEAALGVYSLAWNLAEAPMEKVNAMLTDVIPSLFAAVQNDQASLRRYFLNMTELLAFVTFPAAIGIAVTSPDLVATLLGPKWSAAVLPLAVLAGYSVARSTTFLFGHVFLALGDVKFTLQTAVAFTIVLPVAFLIGSHWGPTGIAVAWVIAHPPLTFAAFLRIRTLLDIRGRDYLRTLRLGADGSAVMAVAVVVSRHVLGIESNALRLAVDIAIGVVAFAGTTFLIHRGRLREIIEWFRRIRR